MTYFWRDKDELGERLRAARAEPRAEFLDSLVNRLESRRGGIGVRRRLAVAAALTVGLIGAVGAFGGIGYASSATSSFARAVEPHHNLHLGTPSHPGEGRVEGTDSSAGNSPSASSSTPASDEYVGKTTICHRTGSSRHPFVIIAVSNNALPAHTAHGDTLTGPGGTCPGPPIP
jgi:hypothetical protein